MNVNGRIVGQNVVRLDPRPVAENTVTASVVGTTETVLGELATIPLNTLKPGVRISGLITGRLTCSGVGAPTWRVRMRYGGTGTDGTVILDSGAITLATAVTDGPFWIDYSIAGLVEGSNGEIWTNALVQRGFNASIGAMHAMGQSGTVNTASNDSVEVDTTITAKLYLTLEYSSNTAGNSITISPCCHTLLIP